MREINTARSIINKRKEKGLTQDDIANYIGVTKASVSKWETGRSYPDITFLPQLASYFDISIDELMGYEPQLTKAEIRKLNKQLSKDFTTLPYDDVAKKCREIAKKYFSCFPLLFQIGTLMLNYNMLSMETTQGEEVIEEARRLFVRIRTNSSDLNLAKQAQNMEAYCLLKLGKPEEVLTLLDPDDMALDISLSSSKPLLASAYEQTGDMQEAKRVYQKGIYQYVVGLMNLLPSYLKLCREDENAFEETYNRTMAMAETFQIKKLYPTLLMAFYINTAQECVALGDIKRAFELLDKYTQMAVSEIFPLSFHGDDYFNTIDTWLEDWLALGMDFPRDEKTIRKNMTEVVANNKAFLELKDQPHFRSIVLKLKNNEKVNIDS